jgi:arsenate reductase
MEENKIISFVGHAVSGIDRIPDSRLSNLDALASYIQERKNDTQIDLIFICVHNSRRSHFSQVWAQVAANHFGLLNVRCYSGGTEATAVYPAVVETLLTNELEIKALSECSNPVYSIKYDQNQHPIIGFSKIYDDSFNPAQNFAAVMVCSAADENCPFIPGADKRIAIPYEDPKEFDNTPFQMEKYAERSLQIATEMFYVFSKIK